MIEKLKKSLDQVGEYAVLFTHLSNAFDCLPHDLLIEITCLQTEKASLMLIHSFLTDQ